MLDMTGCYCVKNVTSNNGSYVGKAVDTEAAKITQYYYNDVIEQNSDSSQMYYQKGYKQTKVTSYHK